MEIFHIKKYIETRKRDLGLTNGSLARRIGRTEKTLRRLERFMKTLKENEDFILRVKSAIQAEEGDWNLYFTKDQEILNAIEEAKREKEREAFRPHLWLVGKRSVPSPIFVVAMMGEFRFKYAPLPINIDILDLPKQFKYAFSQFKKTYKANDGLAGPFGEIVGYFYRRKYDLAYEFDKDGKQIGVLEGYFPIPKASLTVGNREIGIRVD